MVAGHRECWAHPVRPHGVQGVRHRGRCMGGVQTAETGLGPADADLGESDGGASDQGRKRGAAEGGVAMPREEEAKKREPRGAGGCSAGSSSAAV
eukprot:1162175-Prymnesium_polylepis.1